MKTLIELYDSEPVNNVFAQDTLHFERVVFVGGAELCAAKKTLCEYFRHHGAPEVVFRQIDVTNADKLYSGLLQVIKEYPGCMVDLTGGSDDAVFAAGRLCGESDAGFIKSDIENMCVRGIYSAPDILAKNNGYTIDDIISLAGGRVRGFGHYNLKTSYEKLNKYVEAMFSIVLEYHDVWYRQVRYFQSVLRGRTGYITAPTAAGEFCVNEEIMDKLYRSSILKSFERRKDTVSFSFADDELARLICDVGVWLELYVYKAVLESGVYSDVGIGVEIDWDGIREEYDVTNEVDVMACCGAKSLFISCKTGPVSVEALNELCVLRSRFGGAYSAAAVVTATRMSQYNLCTYKRAAELGIKVIELDDLLAGDLKELIGGY